MKYISLLLVLAVSAAPAAAEEEILFGRSAPADVNLYYRPSVLSVTAFFSDPDLVLDAGQEAGIVAEIRNLGAGTAREVTGYLSGEVPAGMTVRRKAVIGTVGPGEAILVEFALAASEDMKNGRAALKLFITEKFSRFPAVTNIMLTYGKYSAGSPSEKTRITTSRKPFDVDVEIPVTERRNDYGVAVVIGNRDYRSRIFPAADYALRDARIFREYSIKTLGFRSDNVLYVQNAPTGMFDELFGTDKAAGKLGQYIRPDTTDVVLYYSGLGTTDPKTSRWYWKSFRGARRLHRGPPARGAREIQLH